MSFLDVTTPSWWRKTVLPVPYGVFYQGESPDPYITFLAGATATGYSVRDYWGSVVSSGAFSGTTCTPTPPTGGWKPGWYRIYFTGPQTDATYGNSYGATSFVVVRPQSFLQRITTSWPLSSGGESRDQQLRGMLGLAASRLIIGDASDLTAAPDSLTEVQADLLKVRQYWTEPTVSDPARQSLRAAWAPFPNESVDRVVAYASVGAWMKFYCRTAAIPGDTTFVQIEAGTTTGSKVTIRSPDSATIVETYDNLTSASGAAATIMAGSSFVKAYTAGASSPLNFTATAIGSVKRSNVAAVVSALYPYVQRFEGPSNESTPSAEVAHRMMLFRTAVKEGNAAALAIGPCFVAIRDLAGWEAFLAAGGGDYCDEISTHAYNTFEMGTISARPIIEAWLALLAQHGQSGKVRWDTESVNSLVPQGGVYCPRESAMPLLMTLIWEQYGVPRERAPYWYDQSHGFWSFPAWLMNSDKSLNPQAAMYRILVEETWGMLHSQRLTFGPVGDQLYLGSVYRDGSGAGACILIGNSPSQSGTVTLTVSGASSLTLVDAFGNTSTTTVTGGRVTVPVSDTPVYLRLPSGATVTPWTVNGWPPIGAGSQTIGIAPRAAVLGGEGSLQLSDGAWLTDYYQAVQAGTQLVKSSITSGSDEAVITFDRAERLDRLIIFGVRPPAYNGVTVPISLAVDTSPDGSTWTQRWSYTNPTAVSIRHPTASVGTNCTYDSLFDRQWIFDASLPGPVTCKAVRVRIIQVSVGSEVDANTAAAGNGLKVPRVMLQEIVTMCDDNTKPQWVVA